MKVLLIGYTNKKQQFSEKALIGSKSRQEYQRNFVPGFIIAQV